MSIIKSVLDTDLYKFTTSYAYSKLFPRANGQFEFVDRSNDNYHEGFEQLLREELKSMEQLCLTDEEEAFLIKKLPYLPPTYIDFLKGFRYNSS
ncbi:MAG: nicotinate phosphoribosyltransferase, partial [Bacteroidales bacterium]|nr:nicotinate phosphoribosyltransferase [Bacteroidales bacterium]